MADEQFIGVCQAVPIRIERSSQEQEDGSVCRHRQGVGDIVVTLSHPRPVRVAQRTAQRGAGKDVIRQVVGAAGNGKSQVDLPVGLRGGNVRDPNVAVIGAIAVGHATVGADGLEIARPGNG